MTWGVIEGFYGKPWTQAERLDLFLRLAASGLDAYFYAPKDDHLHRARWRELYPPDELAALAALVEAAHAQGIAFWYGLAPGLDLVHASETDRRALLAKLAQVRSIGVDGLALLFDDIPAQLAPEDQRRFGTLAAAQADVAREAQQALGGPFLFCPTEYCGVMSRGLTSPYLAELGRALPLEIGVLWTGPDIISLELEVAHVRAVAQVLGRKPVIWDNLFANDYDMRRLHLGPFAGRPLALKDEVAGLFLNPNCEHEANAVALLTFGGWRRAAGAWDARAAYEAALAAWLPRWDGAGISLEELRLFCDAYHLPGELGETAREWLGHLGRLAALRTVLWGDSEAAFLSASERLFAFSDKIASLHHRPLLHAVLRHGWELKEELHILRGWVRWRRDHPDAPFFHPHARPPIYKGALLTRLRGVLDMAPDGGLRPPPGG